MSRPNVSETISVTLKVWRQPDGASKGWYQTHEVADVDINIAFLEMLDLLNQRLEKAGKEPLAFDHDCREGICGACGAIVNGVAHGPARGTSLCQLRMRHFSNGDTIVIEPWRNAQFPVVRDLVVNRAAFDRIIAAGGYISVRVGSAPEANALPIGKDCADSAFTSAQCIGCGACAAVCPNSSAMLFVCAKANHLNGLPQGQPERELRTRNMLAQMKKEGFGDCTNNLLCQASCPKSISVENIERIRHEFPGLAGK